MPFKVAARTILHLGAELISSDGIAFYELIKNAFDAGSKRVNINVIVRIPFEYYSEFIDKARRVSPKNLNNLKDRIIDVIDYDTPDAQELENAINNCTSQKDLLDILDDANFIKIRDKGEGMSLEELDKVYLTIGTRSRYTKKKKLIDSLTDIEDEVESSIEPILGEKGVGRLSAMRLGQKLKVKTTRAGELKYNLLEIDWGLFSHDSDQMLDEIPFEPEKGGKKKDKDYSGTSIVISRLETEWSIGKVEEIVHEEFSKLRDPFHAEKNRIIVKFNDEKVTILKFDERLFAEADAEVKARLSFSKENNNRNVSPLITVNINYLYRNKKDSFNIKGTDVISEAFSKKGKNENLNERVPSNCVELIRSLGSFNLHFYWYNRQRLHAIDGIGDKKQVSKLVNKWAGGLKVYRDGFRVNPYGNPDDDWLDLDRKAFGSSGYKVNKQQIIGKVDISSTRNPKLVDQTNREGLRSCIEKEIFVNLLGFIVTKIFKKYIQDVDKEIIPKKPITVDDIKEQLEDQRKKINLSFKYLLQEHPEIKKTSGNIIDNISDSIDYIANKIGEVNSIAASYKKSERMLLDLAGLGQMVKIITHELNRATKHALNEFKNNNVTSVNQLRTIESQLKTIYKRLRVLDPLDTLARQQKEKFDLIDWTKENLDFHEGQFDRHGIALNFSVKQKTRQNKFPVNLVKGMIVQVLENLIENSVYWLKLQKRINSTFKPEINVLINPLTKQIVFSDNGSGIEWERREKVFEPYESTKKDGNGLGLYIAREIAKYHGISIALRYDKEHKGNLSSTFVIDFGDPK